MFVRCAYFEGHIDAVNRVAFERCVTDEVAPQMAKFPGCREVRVLHGKEHEEGAPNFCLVLEHYYDSLGAIKHALASENRIAVWDRLNKVMPFFKGSVKHINHQVDLVIPGR